MHVVIHRLLLLLRSRGYVDVLECVEHGKKLLKILLCGVMYVILYLNVHKFSDALNLAISWNDEICAYKI